MDAQEFSAARWDLRLSQTALARHLRVHISTVNKWEKGLRRIPQPVADAMRTMLAERAKIQARTPTEATS